MSKSKPAPPVEWTQAEVDAAARRMAAQCWHGAHLDNMHRMIGEAHGAGDLAREATLTLALGLMNEAFEGGRAS
jgi:hypothetical protein